MGGGGEALEVEFHGLVDHLVVGEEVGEAAELVAGGEFAVDDEVGGLDEGGVLGDLFDGDAAVAEDAFFAVYEGDGALAGAGVGVAVIEGDETGLGAELGDVEGQLAFGSAEHGELVGLAIKFELGEEFGLGLWHGGGD